MNQGVTHRRMYDSVRWRKARRMWLAAHPVCAMCARQGRTIAANTVDHIRPHDDDYDKFWDMDNWQSLCSTCHNSIKQQQERHCHSQAADINGLPIDSGHPWNKK